MRKSIFCLIMCIVFLGGCTQHSVRHLSRQPWMDGMSQTLDMKYWSFRYMTEDTPEKAFRISGEAYPNKATIPGWGSWLRSCSLMVYLCDDKGNVLAREMKNYQEQKMPYGDGLPFAFVLDQKELQQVRPLFVTFGYRMEAVESRTSSVSKFSSELTGDYGELFYARQGSILR